MERKLVKQGRNALTVTLPAQWLKEKGLTAGDSVFVKEQNKQLLISTTMMANKTSVTVDLKEADRSMIFHVAMGKYIEGYDTIILHHDCPSAAKEVVNNLIGMIIEEHTPTKLVLRSIVQTPEDNFAAVLRRAAHIFVQQARTLVELAKGTVTLEQVKAEEKLLDQNILYCLRYLNKYENREHAYKYFLTCATIELAADQVTRIAQHIGKQEKLAQTILEGIEEYASLLFANDFKKMYSSLRSFRSKIAQKTFADGLAFSLAEILYNYIGYIHDAS